MNHSFLFSPGKIVRPLLLIVLLLLPAPNARAQESMTDSAQITATQLCLVPPEDGHSDEYVSFSGLVTDAETDQPVAGVRVVATEKYGRTQYFAYTSAAGTYTVEHVLAGDYYFYFDTNISQLAGTHYISIYNDAAVSPTTVPIIHADAGEAVSGINAELSVGAPIKGKVTAADTGGGVQSANVRVYDVTGHKYLLGAQTDAGGNYEAIGGLAPGDYLLYIYASDFTSAWYNGHSAISDADPITIVGTQAKTVNIALEDAVEPPVGRIAGRVTVASSGNPIAGARVYPRSQGFIEGFIPGYATTDASGYYTLTVAVGSFKIYASPPSGSGDLTQSYYGGDGSVATAVVINVTANQTITDKNIALSNGVYIEGTVTGPGGIPIDYAYVLAYEGPGYLESGNSRSTNTDPDGHFSIGPLPADEYTVVVQPPSPLCDLVSGTFSVDLPAVAAGGAATLNPALSQGQIFAGRVTNEETKAGIWSGFVRVYDASGATAAGGSLADTGYYLLPAVAPGSYRVGATSTGFADAWFNGKDSLASATVLAATANQARTDINLALGAGGTGDGGVYIPLVMK